MKITPGEIVAEKYKIEKILGEGATGIVYLAKDQILSKYAAIKFLRREFSLSVEQRKRFLNEARVASHFIHESVVAIREVSEWKGHLFIIMDYHEGKTLKEFMQEKALTKEEILTLSQQLLSCLQAAHIKKIVHRDIKPSNLMVYFDKKNKLKLKILDFGLAYCDEYQNNASGGTLNYISPEQLLDDPVDHRSDLYSVAVCIYEMHTGVLPVSGETANKFVYNLLQHKALRNNKMQRPLNFGLKKVLMKALASDPEARYQNAQHFWEDLKSHGNFPFYEMGKKLAIIACGLLFCWFIFETWTSYSIERERLSLIFQSEEAYDDEKFDDAVNFAKQSQKIKTSSRATFVIQQSTFAKIKPLLTEDPKIIAKKVFSLESTLLLKKYFGFYPISKKISTKIAGKKYTEAIKLIKNYDGLSIHKNLLKGQLSQLYTDFYRQQFYKALKEKKSREIKKWYNKLKGIISPEERKKLRSKIHFSDKKSDYEEAMYLGDYWKATKIAETSKELPFWHIKYLKAKKAFDKKLSNCVILSPRKGKIFSKRVVIVKASVSPHVDIKYLRINNTSLEYQGNIFSAEIILEHGLQKIRLEYQRENFQHTIHEVEVIVDVYPPELKVSKYFVDEENKELVIEGTAKENTRIDTIFYKNIEAQPLNAAFDKWQISIPLKNSLTSVTLTAKDIVQNMTTFTVKLEIDTKSPEVYIEFPQDNQKLYNNKFTIIGMSIDDSKIDSITVFSKKVTDFRRDKWYAPIELPLNTQEEKISIPVAVTDIWGNVKKKNIVIFTEYRKWQGIRLFKKLKMHKEKIWGLCYDHEGKYLISAANDGKKVVWDTKLFQVKTVEFVDVIRYSHLKISPAIRFTASLFANITGKSTYDFFNHSEVGGTWRVNDLELKDRDLGELVRFFDKHISCIALSPDGQFLAMGHHSGNLRIINLRTRRYILHSNVHNGVILSLCYSSDNKWLASGGGDHKIKLWPVRQSYRKKYHPTHTLIGHQMSVTALSFSFDSTVLASGSKDKKVYLWDVEKGRKIKRLSGHTSKVESVSFSPVEMTLCTASSQGEMFIWK